MVPWWAHPPARPCLGWDPCVAIPSFVPGADQHFLCLSLRLIVCLGHSEGKMSHGVTRGRAWRLGTRHVLAVH